MEESLGLGKKSSGAETDTETWSWFRLPIPKPGFGHTLKPSNLKPYTFIQVPKFKLGLQTYHESGSWFEVMRPR